MCDSMPETIGICGNCGLCCQHLLVEADVIDVLREPRIDAVRPLGKLSPQLSLLDACWVLAGPGTPCAFLTPDKRCAIYPTRPQICVAFVPGSTKCQKLRNEYGLPPVVLPPSIHRILTDIMKAAIAKKMEEPAWR